MSHTRLPYDSCTAAYDVTQSVGPGHYMVDAPWCPQCVDYAPNVKLSRNGVTVSDSLVDVDSELLGITRKRSRCPARQYLPSEKQNFKMRPPVECTRSELMAEDTRVSNPPCTLRCNGVNRWQWLCRDPQERVTIPFDWNINNKMVVKDNHRPCIPKPIDQTASFPPPMPDPDVSWSSCFDDTTLDKVSPSVTWIPKNRFY
jgi:hypothetical protein